MDRYSASCTLIISRYLILVHNINRVRAVHCCRMALILIAVFHKCSASLLQLCYCISHSYIVQLTTICVQCIAMYSRDIVEKKVNEMKKPLLVMQHQLNMAKVFWKWCQILKLHYCQILNFERHCNCSLICFWRLQEFYRVFEMCWSCRDS